MRDRILPALPANSVSPPVDIFNTGPAAPGLPNYNAGPAAPIPSYNSVMRGARPSLFQSLATAAQPLRPAPTRTLYSNNIVAEAGREDRVEHERRGRDRRANQRRDGERRETTQEEERRATIQRIETGRRDEQRRETERHDEQRRETERRETERREQVRDRHMSLISLFESDNEERNQREPRS